MAYEYENTLEPNPSSQVFLIKTEPKEKDDDNKANLVEHGRVHATLQPHARLVDHGRECLLDRS